MAKRLTDEDRQEIEKLEKEQGLGRVLSKEDHLKLIKGKQIMFSEQSIEDFKRRDQKIPEHYHVGWIDKDNNMSEVLVTGNGEEWEVIDDWGDINEVKTLGKFEKSKDAIFYALDILSVKFKGGKPVYGAGAPSNKVIEQWLKKNGKVR